MIDSVGVGIRSFSGADTGRNDIGSQIAGCKWMYSSSWNCIPLVVGSRPTKPHDRHLASRSLAESEYRRLSALEGGSALSPSAFRKALAGESPALTTRVKWPGISTITGTVASVHCQNGRADAGLDLQTLVSGNRVITVWAQS